MRKANMFHPVLLIYMFMVVVDMILWMQLKHAFLKIAETHAQYGTTCNAANYININKRIVVANT